MLRLQRLPGQRQVIWSVISLVRGIARPPAATDQGLTWIAGFRLPAAPGVKEARCERRAGFSRDQ
jgi:hypothetical protein